MLFFLVGGKKKKSISLISEDVYKNLGVSREGVRSGKGLDMAGSMTSSAAWMCVLTSWLRVGTATLC